MAAAEEAGKEAGTRVERCELGLRGRREIGNNFLRDEMRTRLQAALPLTPELTLGDARFLQIGALLAPVAPSVAQGDKVAPASLDGLGEGGDEDGRSKIDSRCGQNAGHKRRALEIQVVHQPLGEEQARNTLDGPSLP